MKLKYCLLFLVFAPLVACSPRIDKADWENEIKPAMLKELAVMKISEALDENEDEFVTDKLVYYSNLDFHYEDNLSVALDWFITFLNETLLSYEDIAELSYILDDPETGSLFPEPETWDEGWQVAYIMELATIFENIYAELGLGDLALDTPEFVKKTKDRNFYSVYCPRYNEYYTLSEDAENYQWSFD